MSTSLKTTSDTFCSLPWNHTFVGPGGIEKPCCRFLLNQLGPIEDLRETILRGERHPGCRKCWEEEDAGRKRSLRQIHLQPRGFNKPLIEDLDIGNPKLVWLELSFSNRCNLRCRMCSPFYSTNWYKDWLDVEEYLYPKICEAQDVEKFIKEHPEPVPYDISNLDKHIPNIRHIKMTGGEPFIIPEYQEILEKIVANGTAGEVVLNYSTNLTVMPKPRLLALWANFKRIEFATSFDATGKVMEYQRHPTKWPRVEQVLDRLINLPNAEPGIRGTVTIYNILDIPNVAWYWNDILPDNTWLNFVQASSPEQVSITVLPKWAKDIVANKLAYSAPTQRIQDNFDQLVNYMYNEDNSHRLPQFIDFTQKLDKARGEDFKKVVPEFASLW